MLCVTFGTNETGGMQSHVPGDAEAVELRDGAMRRADIQTIVDETVRRITGKFNPEKIILFGSCVNGLITDDSDLDILVVMNINGSQRGTANEIDLTMADRTVPMDFIVVTPEQFERQKDMFGTIIGAAAREGRVIYDRAA